MRLRDRIAARLGVQVASAIAAPNAEERIDLLEAYARASGPISFAGMDGPYRGLGNEPSQEKILEETIGWAAIAVRAISDRFSGLELEVGEGQGLEFEATPENPLQDLLDTWSPLHDRNTSLGLIGEYVPSVGEAFFLKVTDGVGFPRELWTMTPQSVAPIVEGGDVVAFEVTSGGGKTIRLAEDEVLRFWRPNPLTLYSAQGVLVPQALAHDASKFLSQHLRTFYERDATPKLALEPNDNESVAPDDPERLRFELKWQTRYNRRLGTRIGVPVFGVPGWKFRELQTQGGADLVVLLETWAKQILMAYGVPRSIVGDVVDANRAAAETNQYVFDVHTIKPIATRVASALTIQLARPLFGSSVTIRFREFVLTDKDFELRQEDQDLRQKVRSINQVLETRGLDPVPWGDLPVGTPIDTPYTGEELEPIDVSLEEPEDLEPPPEDDDDEGRARVAGDPRALEEWLRVLNRERTFVPPWKRGMRGIFAEQKRQVLAALAELFEEERARTFERQSTEEMLELLRSLFRPESWETLFEAKVEKIRTQAYQRSGGEAIVAALEAAGQVGRPFSFTAEAQRQLLEQAETFRRVVNQTTLAELGGKIEATLAEGLSIGEPLSLRAKRVQEAVGKAFRIRSSRALTIARTETLIATEAAQLEGFDQSGVNPQKRWNTSKDEAVRGSHRIDGQVRDLDEPFDLPEAVHGKRLIPAEKASAPGVGVGGERLSAANTIGCRCFVTPVVG